MKRYLFAGFLIAILAAGLIANQGAQKATESDSAPKAIKLHYTDGTSVFGEIEGTAEPTATATETPTSIPTAAPTAEPTAVPTETPTPEPTVEPTADPRLLFWATAYSSDPAENGGYGAVDCLYGRPLPADAIAADLSVLPYGTRVYIDGIGERVVVDTASETTLENMRSWASTKGCVGWLDIYVGDDKAWMHDWGVRAVTVTILEWGTGR